MLLTKEFRSVKCFGSDIKCIIDIGKRFPYNPLKGYININFLKEKVILLTDLLLNNPIDTLSLKKIMGV